ncbi:glycoside hydrolase family 1 protein [Fundicoccus culcitae]|uniref:Glycoside hydrolase family 1 protein n=1 Tax=Fundicoccus culcitae TaxID=2969821 RepID=A0ABY5P9P3_9LACT|nr:glycoside hydrolase family 1 protein [Fundicoccus culcitae]
MRVTNQFPEHFWWGAAASAPQTEGASDVDGKSPTTWDVWHEREPEAFFNQVGPDQTSDVYHRYREDVQLMKDMNLNSYRTSIAWARLLPDGKTLNEKAVAYYRDYFQTMRDKGIEPVINLFHFDMPWWMMELGGWENPAIVEHFAYYAKMAFEEFGDIVKYWATFNEPMVHIECGYLGDAHWPRVNDFKRAIQVGYHTLMAHFAAVRVYRQVGSDGKIGTILNLSPVYARSDAPEDQEAQRWADLFHTRSLLDPIALNTYPQELVAILKEHDLMPTLIDDHASLTQEKIDFLGVNYYQPLRVKARDEKALTLERPSSLYASYDWPEKKMNPYRGWEIYEKGIYDIAMRIKNDYGNIPWFISENGMGVAEEERFIDESGIVQDTYRIEFIRDHLSWLLKSIEEGSNCFGYHLWTFIDCWSWLNAYKNRYGYYRVDLENDLERTPKLSSFWLRDIIEKNQLDI